MEQASAPTAKRRDRRALRTRLHPLVKRAHLYLGLVNLTMVLVWGITGTYATLSRGEGREPPSSVRTVPYMPTRSATDREIAMEVFGLVKPPLAGTLPAMSMRRDPHKNLVVTFYRPGAVLDATVFEDQGQIRVEQHMANLASYFSGMHEVTMNPQRQSIGLRLWSYYTELSIWSLLVLALSGVLMWLLSRPLNRTAQLCFGGGMLLFFFLYMAVR